MSKISFRIVSIQLNDSVLNTIDKNNLLGIRLIQKPQQAYEEFIVSNEISLQNFDHEFYIENHFDKIEKIIMIIRSVQSCFSKTGCSEKNNQNSESFERNDENTDENAQINNETKKIDYKNKSFIGYCAIDMSKTEKGVNNTFKVDIYSKLDEKSIGYANLEIYILNNSSMVSKTNNEISFSQKKSKPRHITEKFIL